MGRRHAQDLILKGIIISQPFSVAFPIQAVSVGELPAETQAALWNCTSTWKAMCKGTWCPLELNAPQWCSAALISPGKHILHALNKWGLLKPDVFIHLVGAVKETKQPVILNTRKRTKIFAAHCTKCCPWESKAVCHAVLARSLPTARTEINRHRGLKGRTSQGLQNRP